MPHWRLAPFEKLSPQEVHDMLRARADVFVVEQACVFPDIDGRDPECWHLIGRAGAGPRSPVIAYCRLVPARVKYEEPSIGRVLTTAAGRRQGLGRELVREALARLDALWPGHAVRIGAQLHLERFYASFGFARVSEPYDEDGIQHIDMVRAARSQQHA
ncbi:MAG TPA: GNAT family N-acetyltransferase [Usitatibacter sp.]|jgi:ElaA protein|nr:GNAT family N-acetyltransferase [Usitatibacter sp.]